MLFDNRTVVVVKCEYCGDVSRNRFCDFCDKLYFKDEKMRERVTPNKKKPERVIKPLEKRACKGCGEMFMQKTPTHTYCSYECHPKPVNEFDRWVNKKPREQKMDSDQVGYSFFRKKYGPGLMYKTVRG